MAKRNEYIIEENCIDSVELKCLLVSRGLSVKKEVYQRYSKDYRFDINPLTCNSIILSDGTIVQMTDVSFHLKYLSGILSWNNIKLLKYASDLSTPFSLRIMEDKLAVFHKENFIDYVTLPKASDFYRQKTTSGLPFLDNAVLQGVDWVSFQCLWPCDYAASGKGCEFCFSGGDFETLTRKKKPLPPPVDSSDVVDIIDYALRNDSVNSIQLTGGSMLNCSKESSYIKNYLNAINEKIGMERISGEILLYITPPEKKEFIDDFFNLGASRIACSLELWDTDLAKIITPGKIDFATRERYLDALIYTANKYGSGSAFSNFIIGIEPIDSLKEGATFLAQRGILPTASVWMPMGRPVNGTMQAPDIDYYRRVKELFAELYDKYELVPADCCGLNVCIEKDIYNYSKSRFSEM